MKNIMRISSTFYSLFALLSFVSLGIGAQAQLTVVPSNNAAFLVNQLIGPGITVSNATINTQLNAAGTFNGTASNIGLPSGVLLTSGDVANAPGPNVNTGITTAHFAPGDPQLDLLTTPFLTEDACILEFDLVAICDTIQISYVFGSDEYDEYVCTDFTDVFAFFISGPGITGTQNIAVIPGSLTPVSINTVNIGAVGINAFPPYPTNCNTTNSAFFTTNNVGTTVEYDGFTVPLIAKSAVIPCSTYHIKLAIADAGDASLDSGVFLEEGGIRCASAFFSVEPEVNSPTSSFAVEGCVNGGFTFHRDGDTTGTLTMYYNVGGTATPGADYPALPGSITFPAMVSTVTVPIAATADGLVEGVESIFVILSDTVCNTIVSDTATLLITDELDVDAGPDDTLCQGSSVQIGVTGNPAVNYTWSPTTGLSNPNIADPVFTGTTGGTFNYIVTATDTFNCMGSDTVVLTVTLAPNANFTAPANVCIGSTATITYNGNAPGTSTYNWNFAGGTVISGSGQGPYQVSWPAAGQMQVTLTVTTGGCISPVESVIVNVTDPPILTLTPSNPRCFGRPEGSITTSITSGSPGFTFLWSNGATTPNLNGVLAGSYSVTVTDAVGCTDDATVVLTQPSPMTNTLSFSPILCFGGTGSITANPGGGSGSYTYLWSNGGTTQTINPPSGTYTVTVTDANSGAQPCEIVNMITLNEPTQMTVAIATTIASCGQSNATATAIVNGGTQPYTYSWSTGATTPFVSGLGPGTISVTVTDDNGCTVSRSETILQTPLPVVTAGPDAAFCEGEGGGGISAVGSIGIQPYSYTWWCTTGNCGLDSLFDNDPIANPSVSQWYYVQVTDANGCVSNIDSLFVTILPKPIVNAGPDLWLCGDNAPCQILTPTITGAPGPYTFQWTPSTGLNDPTIMNPCARPDSTTIYALVVGSGNGCTSDYTTTDTLATVIVNVNPIPIADGGPDRDICLGDQVMLQGIATGAGPAYQYEWSPTTGLSNPSAINPIASPPITTVYTFVVISNNCPSYGDSVTVNVHTRPTVDAGWDQEICLGETAMLDASASGDSTASYTFTWSPNIAFVGSNQVEDPSVNPTSTTLYYVEATSNYGCGSALDSVLVTLKSTPIADAGPNLNICLGDSIVLEGAFTYTTLPAPVNDVFFSWTPGANMNDTTLLQPTVWPSASTMYVFEVRYADCRTMDSVMVIVGPEVLAQAGADTTVICGGESVTLLSTGTIGTGFSWTPTQGLNDPSAANPVATPTETTTYTLQIGEGACLDSATVTVQVLPQPEAAYLNSPANGCAPHAMSFMQTSSNATAYTWNFGDGSPVSNQPEPMHIFEAPGSYVVTLTAVAPGGCTAVVSSTTVTVAAPSVAAFTSTPSFPAQLSIPATFVQFIDGSKDAVSWNWDFGDGLASSSPNPEHTYGSPGTYYVTLTVTNAEGCATEITHGPFLVLAPSLFIPNVFSPNDDGVNDEFVVNYTGDQHFSLQIFDRWGVLQFSSINKVKGWDGTNPTGLKVVDGVYYYKITAGTQEYVGEITLVR
jgi:gliding motility-associated-like protein